MENKKNAYEFILVIYNKSNQQICLVKNEIENFLNLDIEHTHRNVIV